MKSHLEELVDKLDAEVAFILDDIEIQRSLIEELVKTLRDLRPFVTDAIWAQSGATPALCEYEARYE